jgi:hypothetical protein
MTIRRLLQLTLRVLLTPLAALPGLFFAVMVWPLFLAASVLDFAVTGKLRPAEYVEMYWGSISVLPKIVWGSKTT